MDNKKIKNEAERIANELIKTNCDVLGIPVCK